MFILAVLGNVTYALGIFLYSVDGKFLLQKLPWLVGSVGTLCFDFTVSDMKGRGGGGEREGVREGRREGGREGGGMEYGREGEMGKWNGGKLREKGGGGVSLPLLFQPPLDSLSDIHPVHLHQDPGHHVWAGSSRGGGGRG